MSCWRYTPTPKQDRFQDLLEAICPDFLHTNLTNPMSAQATQTCMMMKLPYKLCETHTAAKLHGETIAMTILAGLVLDLANPGKFEKIHQCRTAQFKFYIGGTDPCSPGSLKSKNRIL